MPVRFSVTRQNPAAGNLEVLRTVVVATEGQTVFTPGFLYEPKSHRLQVFINGLLQYADEDYLEISDTQVRFVEPLRAGDEVLFRYG